MYLSFFMSLCGLIVYFCFNFCLNVPWFLFLLTCCRLSWLFPNFDTYEETSCVLVLYKIYWARFCGIAYKVAAWDISILLGHWFQSCLTSGLIPCQWSGKSSPDGSCPPMETGWSSWLYSGSALGIVIIWGVNQWVKHPCLYLSLFLCDFGF